ncbi:hypothetical protein SDC9_12169 [bioreactor metagenome]|uniref:Uncharacterized protein n=1 Tax=bioreactor metagenome TaxID=1076179 RepID=A0A644TL94_9ZZZZ
MPPGQAGFGHAGGIIFPVGGIGKVLGLQAKSPVGPVDRPILSPDIGQFVAGVKLDTRHTRPHPQVPARFRLPEMGERLALGRAIRIDHQAVVIALSRGGHVPPQGLGNPEVEGTALHGARRSLQRDTPRIHRQIAGTAEFQAMVEHVAPALAPEVEIGMIAEVKGCSSVRDGLVVEAQAPFGAEDDKAQDLQVAGKTLLAIGTFQFKPQGGRSLYPVHLALPQAPAEAPPPAVEMLAPILGKESVFPSVQGEFRARYPVGVATYGGAEVGLGPQIGIQAGKAQKDVVAQAFFVGHRKTQPGSPVIGPGRLKIPRFEGIERDGFPRRKKPEAPLLHIRFLISGFPVQVVAGRPAVSRKPGQ